jgi:hypothetical protein
MADHTSRNPNGQGADTSRAQAFRVPGMNASLKDFMVRVAPWPMNDEPGYINLEWQVRNPHREKPVWIIRSVQQVEAFLALVEQKSNEKAVTNIYFCLSRQSQPDHRSKKYATYFKAVWIDLDVKPNGYAGIEDALNALFDFIKHTHLPPPSAIVISGSGLHVYWISTRNLTIDEWQPYADGLKAAALSFGLKCDAGVIANAAQVLRVPGTRNCKTDPPKRVYLSMLQDEDIDFAAGLKMLLGLSPPASASSGAGQSEKIVVAPAFAHLDPNQRLVEGIAETPLLPFAPIKA